MPHPNSDRNHGSLGKRLERFFVNRRAKRLYNEISREMAFFETRYLKSRAHHA